MQIERVQLDAMVENQLPDGSRIILDSENEKVFALNTTASAAWDACTTPTTLSGVAEKMKIAIGGEVTEEMAEQAILQLQEQKLVKTTAGSQRTRRDVLVKFGAVALPLVVGLTLTEQRAFARRAASAAPPPPATPPPPPSCGIICKILGW